MPRPWHRVRQFFGALLPAVTENEREQASGHERRADQDVGLPLRAEDRHRVDELAEDHLDRPGEQQPHGDAGELGRRQ